MAIDYYVHEHITNLTGRKDVLHIFNPKSSVTRPKKNQIVITILVIIEYFIKLQDNGL